MRLLDLVRGGKPYHCLLLLTGGEKRSILDQQIWSEVLFPELDRVFTSTGCQPSVHRREVAGSGKPRSFGKLIWSSKDIGQWAFSPDSEGKWIFVDLQLFCPGREQLISGHAMPAVYVQVHPMIPKGEPSKTRYSEALLVAVETPGHKGDESLRNLLERTREAGCVVAAYTTTLRVGGLNAFESLLRETMMYRGMLDDSLPDTSRMRQRWTILD